MRLYDFLTEEVSIFQKIWHITEKTNWPGIQEDGLMPTHGIHGVQYANRIFFFTTFTPAVLAEVKNIVRFGGIDFDDDHIMNQRADVPLIILEIDIREVNEFDEQMEQTRTWNNDPHVESGVWTTQPIPSDAISIKGQDA